MKIPILKEEQNRLKLRGPQSASYEVHRIIPLGLTLWEAQAWYRNHVVHPQLRRALVFMSFGSAILLSAMLSEFRKLFDSTLSTHMILQPFLFVASGFFLAYGSYTAIEVASRMSNNFASVRGLVSGHKLGPNKLSILTFGAAASLFAFWSLPSQLQEAAVNAGAHVQMYVAFLLAGSLIFLGSRTLNNKLRLFAPVVVGKAMGLYGMFLLVTPFNIYGEYPSYEQAYAGIVLLVVMLGLDFMILPLWLYNYFGRGSADGHGEAPR